MRYIYPNKSWRNRVKKKQSITVSLMILLFGISLAVYADSGANHQIQNNKYGTSGGNIKDITNSFCCSGTLGALVKDAGGVKYILSNNHVLARTDQAAPGEDISQPGLIDNNCRVPRIVGDFFGKAPLGSNVDAAVATLRSGTMNTNGAIQDVGIPGFNVKSPTVGLAVAKSGRTTGFTKGKIGSIHTSVSVQYQKNCGSGKKFVVSYTNQVIINSSTFSAGGDSGSLIVSNTSSTCRQPVALLFAGSSSTTIGNPISQVLTKLNQNTGKTFSFVGQNCTSASAGIASIEPSQSAIDHVERVLEGVRANLMSQLAVIGVGIGSDRMDSTKPVIVIYMDKTQGTRAKLARSIDGVSVRIISTEPFVAF